MLGVRYHPDADAEVIEAALHYEGEREGLGGRFLADFDRALTDIQDSPEAWPIMEEDIRRHQLTHFPYGVIYRIEGEIIRVLAVMHLHRRPGYWRYRK